MKRRILIVGGVAAGASAAARARRLNPEAEIVIFERSGHVSFANCGLPYYVGNIIKDRDALLVQTPELFKARFDIDVRVRHEVEAIDRQNQQIRVKNLVSGKTASERYDRLILAPGASAIVPPFRGIDSENVFFMRLMEDTDAFRAYLDHNQVRRATVVGAGFVGLEAAEALVHRGVRVDVVELLPQVMAPLDADMAAAATVQLRDKGVALHLGTAVENLSVSGNRVSRVVLQDGKAIDTDLVLMSIGVRPNVALAKDAGLEIGTNGGIKINERMETTDPHILAAGDAVEVTHSVTGQPVLIPLAGPANKHGRLAGEIAATDEGPPAPTIAGTAIVKVFDLTVAMTGLTCKAAERAGISARYVMIKRGHHVDYYPGAEDMTVKLVYEPDTRRVLGAQIFGGAGVDRRIDVIATAIHFRGTIDDLSDLDLAYAPPYGAAKDPVNIAGFVAANQERGLVEHVEVADVEALAEKGYQLVDVRSPEEFAEGSIPTAVNVWVDGLRNNADKLSPDRPILAFCGLGQRSYYAARTLKGLGRDDVVSLVGGFGAYGIQKRAAEG